MLQKSVKQNLKMIILVSMSEENNANAKDLKQQRQNIPNNKIISPHRFTLQSTSSISVAK